MKSIFLITGPVTAWLAFMATLVVMSKVFT